jgi:hypothetical protein
MAPQPAGPRAERRKFREPRERLPSPHSFAPPDIARSEAAAAQAVANFFFRENAQTRSVPAKVDHDDNAGLLAKCAAKGNLKGKQYR